MRTPMHLAAAAKKQHDVLTSTQLVSTLTPGEIRASIRARRWQRVGRHVVVLHNGPLTSEQKVWVALLQCPPGSAVSGPTAMAFDGIDDRWAVGVHITLPCGHRRPLGIRAHVHWSAFLGQDDVAPGSSPRRTRLARSVLDWAAWQQTQAASRTVMLRSLQSRRVSADALRATLPGRGPCRHHRVILESISDAEGGIDSVPEGDFVTIVRRAGLPLPAHQVVRQRPGGRFVLDAEWPRYGLSAEVQGVHHFEVDQRERDLDRQNDLVVDGESLLQFTSYAVRHLAPKVEGTLRRALYRRGWREGS
jgi:very-short-patch-repair endonuclease